MYDLVLRLKILRRKRFVVFYDFRETGQFPSQTTTSVSQLGGGEINIVDLCVTLFDAIFDFNLKWSGPLTTPAMLHFIRNCLFPSDLPLHHELLSSLERFKAERIAS